MFYLARMFLEILFDSLHGDVTELEVIFVWRTSSASKVKGTLNTTECSGVCLVVEI